MIANADVLRQASASSEDDASSATIFDSSTRLMMMSYRRQRLLEDVSDPAKRRNFASVQSFKEAYGLTLGDNIDSAPSTPHVGPHPFSQLPAIGKSATPRPMPPASPRAPGQQLAVRPMRIGSPRHGFDGDGAALPPNLIHTAGGASGAGGTDRLVLPAIHTAAEVPHWEDRGGTSLAQAAPLS